VVEEIKHLLQSFGDSSVRAVRREANGVVYLMAKEGCDLRIKRSWHGVPPASIMASLVTYCCVPYGKGSDLRINRYMRLNISQLDLKIKSDWALFVAERPILCICTCKHLD
jgi:hypothetical protein